MIKAAGATPLPAPTWIGIFAHPDDEWVAGWPVFQDPSVGKGVIFFVGDNRAIRDNQEHSESALRRILDSLDIEYLGSLNVPPDFYRLSRNARRRFSESLGNLLESVAIGSYSNASILTHNSAGEYRHPDHTTVLQTVLQVSPLQNVYITDLCFDGSISRMEKTLFYSRPVDGLHELQIERWQRAVQIYTEGYHWTGHQSPGQTVARLYKL
jgi:hypothetical protein